MQVDEKNFFIKFEIFLYNVVFSYENRKKLIELR